MDKNDIIIAKNQYFSMNDRKTGLNNNVLVVGTSGSGKSRSIVSPNLLQANGSYVISDPKGTLYKRYFSYLRKKGYRVVKLDFTDPANSARYNFFKYIRNQHDIIKVAHMLTYMNGESMHSDQFWDNATELLISALISYIIEDCLEREHNLSTMLKLAMTCQVNDEDSSNQNVLDRLMDDLYKKDKSSFAVSQYRKFRIAAGKTLKSILITLSSKLGIYDFEDMRKMMAYDTIRMEKIGQEKTAVFVIISDTDRSMDGMANLFFSQTMQELCSYADNRCRGGRLPMNVRFILDDFATNCKINDFPRIISTIRSRGISAMLMIQAESQLTAGYGVEGNTIISNCDTYVYLGGNDIATAEAVAKRCNVALGRILYMPIGTNWIFRRGMYPINAENFELEPFEASCFEELQKENKDKTLEEQSRIA